MKNQTVWDLNPKMQICYQTADGVKFFKPETANIHARSLKDKTVEPLKRPSNVEALKSKVVKIDELTPMQKANIRKKAIERLDTIEAVNEALEDETAKTVKEAGEARITTLTDLKVKEIYKLTTVEAVEKALEGETITAVKDAGKTQIELIKKAR